MLFGYVSLHVGLLTEAFLADVARPGLDTQMYIGHMLPQTFSPREALVAKFTDRPRSLVSRPRSLVSLFRSNVDRLVKFFPGMRFYSKLKRKVNASEYDNFTKLINQLGSLHQSEFIHRLFSLCI